MELEKKEKIEIEFWKNAPEENPSVYSIPNLINKFKDAELFLDKISCYAADFKAATDILELGAGQGWASCMLKSYYPQARITTTDISPFAIESLHHWEAIFKVKIDERLSCKSYEVPLKDASFDLIFCFAAAHHFVKHGRTLRELKRLLKPGGKILYLHEPACRSYIYPLAKKRVNKKRHEVPEDLLIYRKLRQLARKEGLSARIIFTPLIRNRSFGGTLYFRMLSKLPFLQHILPCTIDVLMKKNNRHGDGA